MPAHSAREEERLEYVPNPVEVSVAAGAEQAATGAKSRPARAAQPAHAQ